MTLHELQAAYTTARRAADALRREADEADAAADEIGQRIDALEAAETAAALLAFNEAVQRGDFQIIVIT